MWFECLVTRLFGRKLKQRIKVGLCVCLIFVFVLSFAFFRLEVRWCLFGLSNSRAILEALSIMSDQLLAPLRI